MATKKKSVKDSLVISKGGKGTSIHLDYGKLRKAVLTLRAVNHPLRKQIVSLIEDKKKITVTEIYAKLHIEQSVASQHLAILRNAEIVNADRDGKFIYYSINKERIQEVATLVENLA